MSLQCEYCKIKLNLIFDTQTHNSYLPCTVKFQSDPQNGEEVQTSENTKDPCQPRYGSHITVSGNGSCGFRKADSMSLLATQTESVSESPISAPNISDTSSFVRKETEFISESAQEFFLGSQTRLLARDSNENGNFQPSLDSSPDPTLKSVKSSHTYKQSSSCTLLDSVPISPSPSFLQDFNKSEKVSSSRCQTRKTSQALRSNLSQHDSGKNSVLESNLKLRGRGFDKTSALDRTTWTVQRQRIGNGGLKNAIMRSQSQGLLDNVCWIGTIGRATENLSEQTRIAIEKKLYHEYQCTPVFVKNDTLHGHYNHYCKKIFWPTLHYELPDNYKSKNYQENSWNHYKQLNEAISDKIIACYQDGDTVWVNDYHLFLVPKLVREKIPNARVGFFLHVAFPSSEVFRCLAARKELLEGLLGSDCIGFQTPEYAKHFLQTCNRILTLDTTPTGIKLDRKTISVVVEPIGIDPENLRLSLLDPEVIQWRKMLRARWPNSKLIVGRDKLERVRGVKQKLLAYEKFLLSHPEMIDTTVLIQVCQINNTDIQLENEVTTLVDRINSLKSNLAHPEPCVFLHKDIEFTQYIALLTEADAFAVTSIREGMNLTCHEFIYCNQKLSPLILSEFTGAAAVLGEEAILVNPWDLKEMAEAFNAALNMEETEKKRHWIILSDLVKNNTCCKWATDFLVEIDIAWNERQRHQLDVIPPLNESKLREDYHRIKNNYRVFYLELDSEPLIVENSTSHNFGTKFLLKDFPDRAYSRDFKASEHESEYSIARRPSSSPAGKSLSHHHFSVHKRSASVRGWSESQLLPSFKGYKSNDAHASYSSSQLKLSLLTELASDPRNIVYVASQYSRATLESMFKHVPNLGLIAENGAFLRHYKMEEWTSLVDWEETREWQEILIVMMKGTVEQLHGAQIEVKGSTVELCFKNCADKFRVDALIGELLNHINDAFAFYSLHAVLRHDIVIISSNRHKKISAIKWAFYEDYERLKYISLGGSPMNIELMFIAAESGKNENDLVFEWGNSLLGGVHDLDTYSIPSASTRGSSRVHSHTPSRIPSRTASPLSESHPQWYPDNWIRYDGSVSGGSDMLSSGSEMSRIETFSTSKSTFKVPIVYTVSVGGPGTSAQFMADGTNGLLRVLRNVIQHEK